MFCSNSLRESFKKRSSPGRAARSGARFVGRAGRRTVSSASAGCCAQRPGGPPLRRQSAEWGKELRSAPFFSPPPPLRGEGTCPVPFPSPPPPNTMSNVHLSSASASERLAARRTFPLHARTGVCRNLFGPVDHDELNRELKSKLREICEDSQRRWEYNFETETPLVGPGRLQWEEVAGEAVPAFYRETLQVGRYRFPVLVLRPSAEAASPETESRDAPRESAASAATLSPFSPQGNAAAAAAASLESAPPTGEGRLSQEKRPDQLHTYSGIIIKPVPCAAAALKRASSASVTHITDFFAKRKRVVDPLVAADPPSALPASVAALSAEQTPRKRLR